MKSSQQQPAGDLALATDGNPLRLLPGMSVRIKEDADSDCAGCEGTIEALEEGTDLATVSDGVNAE